MGIAVPIEGCQVCGSIMLYSTTIRVGARLYIFQIDCIASTFNILFLIDIEDVYKRQILYRSSDIEKLLDGCYREARTRPEEL